MPPRITTTQKGLGWAHQKQAARLKREHHDGTLCWWCAEPMYGDNQAHLNPDGKTLHADHSISRAHGGTQADRLMHAECNKQRGNGDNDHLRPALRKQQGGWAGNTLDWE